MSSIQNFTDYLLKIVSYADNLNYVVKEMNIDEFCNGSLGFKQFIEKVLNFCEKAQLEEIDDIYENLSEYAKDLQEPKKTISDESLADLKKFLKEIIAEPKFAKVKRKSVMEICGNNIKMSDVIKKVEVDPDFNNRNIKEVRVYAKSVLHVDNNLIRDKWHGMNFVVITDKINVTKKNITWDVSGLDNETKYNKAGKNSNGKGINGKDGNPGESGGNVLVKATVVKCGEQLKIISNGGNGGMGQEGGDGDHGHDGKNISKEYIDKIPCEQITLNLPTFNKKKFTTYKQLYTEAIVDDGIEITYIFNTTWKSSLTLVKGTEGTPGKSGGKGGLGGEGGSPGQVDIYTPKKTYIQIENLKGSSGVRGNGGFMGKKGIKGSDMGRINLFYFWSNWNYTKYFGENQNQYLEIYKTTENNDSIWSYYLESYVTIKQRKIEENNEAVKVYQERNNSKEIRERQKHAKTTKSHAIDLKEIQNKYEISFEKLNFDLSNLTTVEVQTNKQSTENVDTEKRFKMSVSSNNMTPTKKILKPVESENPISIKFTKKNHNSEFLEMLKAKHNALKVIKINNEKFFKYEKKTTESSEKFFTTKKVENPHICISELNKNLEERNKIVFEDFRKNVSQEMKKSVLKEFVKETAEYSKDLQVQRVDEAKRSASDKTENKTIEELYAEFKDFSIDKLSNLIMFTETCKDFPENTKHEMLSKKIQPIKVKYLDSWEKYCQSSNFEKIASHLSSCTLTYCPTFMEIVAQKNMLNIQLFFMDSTETRFILRESYNRNCTRTIYITKIVDKFEELEFHSDLMELKSYRKNVANKYKSILQSIEECTSVEQIKSFETKSNFEVKYETISPLYEIVVTGDIEFLKTELKENLENEVVEDLTNKLRKICQLGASSTVHYLSEKVQTLENSKLTIRDINLVINTVMMLADQGEEDFSTVDWILLTNKPEDWISYFTLIRLENHFQKIFKQETTKLLEEYLKNVQNKNIISLLCLKLTKTNPKDVTIDKILHLLLLLSKSDTEIDSIANLKLEDWTFAIKNFYWANKLKQKFKWETNEPYLSQAVQYVLNIENKYEFGTTTKLVDAFPTVELPISNKEDKDSIIKILQKFSTEAWIITEYILNTLKEPKKALNLKSSIENSFPEAEQVRKTDDLLRIINQQLQFNDSTEISELQSAQKRIHDVLSTVQVCIKKVDKLKEEIKKFDMDQLKTEIQNSKKNPTDEKLLAVFDQALFLWSKKLNTQGFYLRDTQKLSALIILKHKRKTLLQVATGEGKSLIVAAISIVRALKGEKVDVITSSSILAERDAEELKTLYDIFGIKVSHNTMLKSIDRQQAYKCDVVYGDLSNFQRDYLLDQFYKKDIRGNRGFSNVVVDEVDSMLLDKGNSTLYLSHEIPELDKLESIYLHIWARVVLGKSKITLNQNILDTDVIANEIKKTLYGLVDKEDIKGLKVGMEDDAITQVIDILKKESIIDKDGFLVHQKFIKTEFEDLLKKHTDIEPLVDQLMYLLKERIEREIFIQSPKYLKTFILENLNMWIDNAKLALYLKDRDDYVVDIDRHEKENLDTVITILDKDTGTDQVNSQWDSGLHQFLQLKHGCRLTPQSLKAVFISNVTYLKKYDQLNGLSGTLGSEVERAHLVQAHEVDFLTIPTFKKKQFIETLPIVTSNVADWNDSIYNETMKKIEENRTILIICESVSSVEDLYNIFQNKNNQKKFVLSKYTRDYEKIGVIHDTNHIEPGNIIISTNLAGRGTDLKLDSKVVQNGGLHVILTYVPANDRIEQQAMGRAARKGEPGSGQLIILSNEFLDISISNHRMSKIKLKRRDKEAEHISSVRTFYDNHIKLEEICFSKFNNAWEENRRRFNDLDEDKKIGAHVQEILERGILDKWAFWLDQNMGNGRKIDKTTINKRNDDFIKNITTLGLNPDAYTSWVDPLAQSIQLGKILAKDEKTSENALKIFDSVITNEPEYCEAAFYYKALAHFNQNKKITDDISKTLSTARKMFMKRKKYNFEYLGLIRDFKQYTATANSQCFEFEDQQKRKLLILDTFIKSIDDILGHVADENILKALDLNEFEIKYAAQKLREKNELFKSLEFKTIEGNILTPYCKQNHIDIKKLKEIVENYQKVSQKDILSFVQHLKNSDLNIPNREEFWTILKKSNVITDQKTLYHLKLSNIEVVDPDLKIKVLAEKRQNRAELSDDRVYLYPELVDDPSKLLTFEESVFLKLIPENTIEYLKIHDGYTINKSAKIDLQKLDSEKLEIFEEYISLTSAHLVTDTINGKVAQNILEELEKIQVLSKNTQDGRYLPTEKYYSFDFHTDEVEIPHIYINMLEEKLAILFSYAIAANHLIKNGYDKTTTINITASPYENLVSEMISHEIIYFPKLDEQKTKNEIENHLNNVFSNTISINELDKIPSTSTKYVKIIHRLKQNRILEEKKNNIEYLVKKNIEGPYDMKTVQNFINTINKLYSTEYKEKMLNVFEEKMGTIWKLQSKFELVTTPLSDFTELEAKQEQSEFTINGQDEILIGQKKANNWLPILLIAIGVVFLVASAIFFVAAAVAVAFITSYFIAGLFSSVVSLGLTVFGSVYLNMARAIQNTVAQKTVRFINEIMKCVKGMTLSNKEDNEAKEEKISRVLQLNVKKMNYANRALQFERILNNEISKLMEQLKTIIKNKIKNAVEVKQFHNILRQLYETKRSDDLSEKLRNTDNRLFGKKRFNDKMKNDVKIFIETYFKEILMMAENLQVHHVESLSYFKNNIKKYVEDGIQNFKEKDANLLKDTIDKKILNEYKESLNQIKNNLSKKTNETLLDSELKDITEAKTKGIEESIIHNIYSLVDQESGIHLIQVRNSIMKKVNFLKNVHMETMTRTVPIDVIEITENDYLTEDNEKNRQSLIELEYNDLYEKLTLNNKFRNSDVDKLSEEISETTFEKHKDLLIKKFITNKYRLLLQRQCFIIHTTDYTFANISDNNQMFDKVLEKIVLSTDSSISESSENTLKKLEDLKRNIITTENVNYSIVLQNLAEIYGNNPISIDINDFYKLSVLSLLKHNFEMRIALGKKDTETVSRMSYKSEIGMIKLNQLNIIAATNNIMQPFVWDSFKLLSFDDLSNDVSVIDVNVLDLDLDVLDLEKDSKKKVFPSVELQLMKYVVDQNLVHEDDKKIRLNLNGFDISEFDHKDIVQILEKNEGRNIKLQDGTNINKETIILLHKLKDCLPELRFIVKYYETLEKVKNKVPSSVKEINEKTNDEETDDEDKE